MEQDRYESEQEKKYQEEQQRLRKTQGIVRMVVRNLVGMVFGNLFALAIYAGLLSKLVSERLQNEMSVAGLVLTYSVLTQIAIILLLTLTYRKDGEENRRLLTASREEGFSLREYYRETMKRFAWILPAVYAVFQLPFLVYFLIFGYQYEAGTLFGHFYLPQLAFCQLLGGGIGRILNTLVMAAVYAVVISVVQRRWYSERIRR